MSKYNVEILEKHFYTLEIEAPSMDEAENIVDAIEDLSKSPLVTLEDVDYEIVSVFEVLRMKFEDLDEFTKAYIECALWATGVCDENGNEQGTFSSLMYTPDNLTEHCLREMVGDCRDFQDSNKDLLDKYYESRSEEEAGHDFLLSREGHGSGFWDRNVGVIGDELHRSAKIYGSINLYLTDEDEIDCL